MTFIKNCLYFVICFCLVSAPSDAPLITVAQAINSQEIWVAWQPPPLETLNGKLQKYEIHVRKTTSVQPTTLPTRKAVATTSTLHAAALSVIMPSAGSVSSSFTSVPLTPKPTTPGGAFPVTEPSEPTQEPGEQRTDQGGSLGVIDAGLVLNYTVRNLDKWTSYEVKVRAVTVAPGPFSNKVIVRTSEDGKFVLLFTDIIIFFHKRILWYDNHPLAKHFPYSLSVVELHVYT